MVAILSYKCIRWLKQRNDMHGCGECFTGKGCMINEEEVSTEVDIFVDGLMIQHPTHPLSPEEKSK